MEIFVRRMKVKAKVDVMFTKVDLMPASVDKVDELYYSFTT